LTGQYAGDLKPMQIRRTISLR